MSTSIRFSVVYSKAVDDTDRTACASCSLTQRARAAAGFTPAPATPAHRPEAQSTASTTSRKPLLTDVPPTTHAGARGTPSDLPTSPKEPFGQRPARTAASARPRGHAAPAP